MNRNFGFHYGEDQALNKECSEEFRGPTAFSEPESQAIRDLVVDHPNMIMAFNFHTFGNIWVYPFAYYKSNDEKYVGISAKTEQFYQNFIKDAKKVTQSTFATVYQSLGYSSEGEVSDWMLGEQGIVSFSPEIGTHDPAAQEFIIPKNLIYDSFLQFMPIIDIAFDKTIFNPSNAQFSFDNRHKLRILLHNDNPAQLVEPAIILRSDEYTLSQISSVEFRNDGELREVVDFKSDLVKNELSFKLPQLKKLRNYEITVHFLESKVRATHFEMEVAVLRSDGIEAWSRRFVNSGSRGLSFLFFCVALVSLISITSLTAMYWRSLAGRKRDELTTVVTDGQTA